VSKIRELLNTERQTTETLRRSLSEVKVLEAFIPICAQCKKIRNQQGVWQQLEVYLREHSNTQFSHGYCPECAKKVMAEAGWTDGKTEQDP
jgi:bacterioferritin-associated ferredoxin